MTSASDEPIVIMLDGDWRVCASRYGDGKCQIAVKNGGRNVKVESVFGQDTYVAAHRGVVWVEKNADFIAEKLAKKMLTKNGAGCSLPV